MVNARLAIPREPTETSDVLELLDYDRIGQDIFVNNYRQWQPPTARGIYGGALLGLCVNAAQRTVSDGLSIHSCHCLFLLAGSTDVPILFHVERIQDGATVAMRRVDARQQDRSIFSATVSFSRQSGKSKQQVRQSTIFSDSLSPPNDLSEEEPEWTRTEPFQRRAVDGSNDLCPSVPPHQRRFRQWIRYRGMIPAMDGPRAHLSALAFLSDGYFILTVARVHRLWQLPFSPEDVRFLSREVRLQVLRVNQSEGLGSSMTEWAERPRIAMVASLNHSIYFHEPLLVKADDWILAEMESPWAAHGRALVVQRIFTKGGTLLATCVQEV
ncbi:hypothetical protein FDECE_11141 [Fusarium decemcellulare]|nr:hypothetical protein FDECE_11141 [Fusarium decemcellulare]